MRTVLLLLFMCAGCSNLGGAPSSANSGDTAAARATATRLENEARALAKTEGCVSADQCRMAPVGERACGGPRLYIPYCAATTDSTALFRKLDELKEAERALNKLTSASSTCEFRMPPVPSVIAGRCSAP